MASRVVNWKLTIVVHRFPFLGIDVLLDHVIRDRARRDRQITASLEMFLPEGLTQVRKLLKEHPRTDALQPLDDCADVLIRAIRHKHVDVIACHFSRQNRQLVLHRDLSDQIAHTNGHLPSQHALPILRDPDQVDFEIGFRVRSVSIPPHATTPTTLFSSPEGEGFRPSPEGTLNGGEDLTIEGQVDGKIELRQHVLTIGPNGKIKAQMFAKSVLVLGEVTGNITATDKVTIGENGSVDGDITAPRVTISEGAHFRGSIDMQRQGELTATVRPR